MAEVESTQIIPSTQGSGPARAIRCGDGHWFFMPLDAPGLRSRALATAQR